MATTARRQRLDKARADSRPSALAPNWAVLPSLFQSLVIALVGFALTGQVELALKERQAEMGAIKQLSSLINQIASPENKNNDRVRQELSYELAMYGVDAIGPLIQLGLTSKLPMEFSMNALTLIAIGHRSDVCAALDSALGTAVTYRATDDDMKQLRQLPVALHCRRRWSLSW